MDAVIDSSISSRDTYNHVSSWLSDARSLANKDIAIILVGNKTDLPNREVTFLEASRYAQENGMVPLLWKWEVFFLIAPISRPHVPGDKRSVRRRCRRDLFEVRKNNSLKNK